MMLKKLAIVFLFIVGCGLSACVEDDNGRADRTTETLNEVHQSTSRDWCSCYGSFYGGYDECMKQFYVEVELTDCERDAVACHVDDFEDYLHCEKSTSSFLTSCTSECSDNDAVRQSCLESWNRRQDDCLARIPERLQWSLTSCTLGTQPGCSPW